MTTQPKDKPFRPYSLRRACPACPFRTDVKPYLRPERAQEIAEGILNGSEFPCHQTTVDVTDVDGYEDRVATSESKACAGALIVMEKSGHVNQLMRIGERLGFYDPERLDMEAPVYDSMADFVRAYRGEDDPEFVHCEVVGPDCEDPAGYMTGSGASENLDEPTVHRDNTCTACGNAACESCAEIVGTADGDVLLCVTCREDD